MLLTTFVLLFSIPFLEIYLIIAIGQQLGALSTIAIIIATAALGAVLVRIEGLSTLDRIKASVQKGELPAIELISGGILILSAIVLLTPGFVTDTIGLFLLTPTIRRKVASVIAAKINVRHSSHSGTKQGKIIDTEFKVDD